MATYGDGTLYGTPGVTYGFAVTPDGPTDLRRRILGGQAPWLTNPVPWRTRCPHVGVLNTARVWQHDLAPFSGGARQIDGRDGVLPAETLTLQLADPTSAYLEDGAHAADVAPNALLGLRWVVTTAAGTLTLDHQSYRVVQAPARTWDRYGREVWQTQAEDWAAALLRQPLGTNVPSTVWAGLSPLRAAIAITEWAALDADPPPTPGGGGTWADVALALVWAACGTDPGNVTADGGLTSGGLYPTGDALTTWTDPLTTTAGGAGPTYASVLEYLGAAIPLRLTYAEGGGIVALHGSARYDSGYVVSTSASVGGAFPVPWERLQRTPRQAEFTRGQFWYTWIDQTLVPPTLNVRLAAQAVSTSRINPDMAPLGRTRSIVQQSPTPVTATNDPIAQGIIDALLQRTLGQADPIELTVDSACPPPRVGDEIRVCVPEEDIDGYWRFRGASIPLSPAAASWSGDWIQDSAA